MSKKRGDVDLTHSNHANKEQTLQPVDVTGEVKLLGNQAAAIASYPTGYPKTSSESFFRKFRKQSRDKKQEINSDPMARGHEPAIKNHHITHETPAVSII